MASDWVTALLLSSCVSYKWAQRNYSLTWEIHADIVYTKKGPSNVGLSEGWYSYPITQDLRLRGGDCEVEIKSWRPRGRHRLRHCSWSPPCFLSSTRLDELCIGLLKLDLISQRKEDFKIFIQLEQKIPQHQILSYGVPGWAVNFSSLLQQQHPP